MILDIPGPQEQERGYICQSRPFTKPPFSFLSKVFKVEQYLQLIHLNTSKASATLEGGGHFGEHGLFSDSSYCIVTGSTPFLPLLGWMAERDISRTQGVCLSFTEHVPLQETPPFEVHRRGRVNLSHGACLL